MHQIIIALSLGAVFWSSAIAAQKCNVAMADWKPRETLQARLEEEGWTVHSIKPEDGCYDAYAINSQGKEVEAYFDPQTLQSVDIKVED